MAQLVTEGVEYTTDINYDIYNDYDQILFKEEVARGTRLLNLALLFPFRRIRRHERAGPENRADLRFRRPRWCFKGITGCPRLGALLSPT